MKKIDLLSFSTLKEFNEALYSILKKEPCTWDICSYEGLVQVKGAIQKLVFHNKNLSYDMKNFLITRIDVVFFEKAKEFGDKYEEYYECDFSLRFPYPYYCEYRYMTYNYWWSNIKCGYMHRFPLASINKRKYRRRKKNEDRNT